MTWGYRNTLAFTRVVQEQNPTRDPYVSWRLHRERGSLGGVDLVAAVGTRLYAPADCTVSNRCAFTPPVESEQVRIQRALAGLEFQARNAFESGMPPRSPSYAP